MRDNGQRDVGLKSPDRARNSPMKLRAGIPSAATEKNIATAVIFGTFGQNPPISGIFRV